MKAFIENDTIETNTRKCVCVCGGGLRVVWSSSRAGLGTVGPELKLRMLTGYNMFLSAWCQTA